MNRYSSQVLRSCAFQGDILGQSRKPSRQFSGIRPRTGPEKNIRPCHPVRLFIAVSVIRHIRLLGAYCGRHLLLAPFSAMSVNQLVTATRAIPADTTIIYSFHFFMKLFISLGLDTSPSPGGVRGPKGLHISTRYTPCISVSRIRSALPHRVN